MTYKRSADLDSLQHLARHMNDIPDPSALRKARNAAVDGKEDCLRTGSRFITAVLVSGMNKPRNDFGASYDVWKPSRKRQANI